MNATLAGRRFEDEWLVRVLSSRGALRDEDAVRLRSEGHPYVSEALLREGLLSGEGLELALRESYGLVLVSPRREDVEKLALGLVPEPLCRRRRLLPLRADEGSIEVAMANPLDEEALVDVRGVTGRNPVPLYCLPGVLTELTDALHDPDGAVFDLLEKMGEGDAVELVSPVRADAVHDQDDIRAPVIRLVNMLIVNAMRRRASDIHIEHIESASVVRYRIDGVLHNAITLPLRLAAGAVVARLKIMANLDIADHLRPQDGRAELLVGGRDLSLRVSTLPTQFGEKAVVRILDRRAAQVSLADLGFQPEQAAKLERQLAPAQGLVIVTGPTGGGKTTTLYSLLNIVRQEGINIVTIEDPVEYRLEGINQVQVQEKQGLGFAQALRSVLRQDPDVIMVGEIRDRDTAEVAIQAAMTGHLVLCTLHANDATAAITRLADMGIEPFKIGSVVTAITAQRLVRRLCVECRKPVPGAPHFQPGRCKCCGFTGYRGRLGLLELFLPDQALRARISAGAPDAELRAQAVKRGALHELGADALGHMMEGHITLEQATPYLKEQSPPAQRPEVRGTRIILAEDEPASRSLLAAALGREGYDVIEVADGNQALDAAAGGADLLLTDLHMPVMDGRELIRRVRAEAGLVGLPVIMLTADQDDSKQQEALEAGADDFLVKPVKPALLAARVKAALRRAAKVPS